MQVQKMFVNQIPNSVPALMKITLGRSIGGLNCDIGGFLDTNVRSILN